MLSSFLKAVCCLKICQAHYRIGLFIIAGFGGNSSLDQRNHVLPSLQVTCTCSSFECTQKTLVSFAWIYDKGFEALSISQSFGILFRLPYGIEWTAANPIKDLTINQGLIIVSLIAQAT